MSSLKACLATNAGLIASVDNRPQDFEAAVKDVVQAKRLSESKMNRMTDAAMKCMEVCIPFFVTILPCSFRTTNVMVIG
jgi:hypothetical protein